jgi:hypothetical protein
MGSRIFGVQATANEPSPVSTAAARRSVDSKPHAYYGSLGTSKLSDAPVIDFTARSGSENCPRAV